MAPVPVEADRLIGDRYVLEALIGRGGMGEVWRARHKALGSPVAIKFLHGASAASEGARRRFLTEAQVTANLQTRHAVRVFDFGVTEGDDLPYLVMELLEGETLARRIAREGRLSIALTSLVMRQAARALDRAHALGIVHRDFKPENVILLPDDERGVEVKVVDFGIARLAGDLGPGALDGPHGAPGSNTLKVTSNAVGTPHYMAPEQIEDAAQVGRTADIWAFGVVAFECLTGERPFEGGSVIELLRGVLDGREPIPASARAPVPEAFDAWFRIACAREPAARFSDASAAASALLAALGDASYADREVASIASPGAGAPHGVSPMAETMDLRASRSNASRPEIPVLSRTGAPASVDGIASSIPDARAAEPVAAAPAPRPKIQRASVRAFAIATIVACVVIGLVALLAGDRSDHAAIVPDAGAPEPAASAPAPIAPAAPVASPAATPADSAPIDAPPARSSDAPSRSRPSASVVRPAGDGARGTQRPPKPTSSPFDLPVLGF